MSRFSAHFHFWLRDSFKEVSLLVLNNHMHALGCKCKDVHIIIEWHSLPCVITCSCLFDEQCHESVLINDVYCILLLEQIEEHCLSYLCQITQNPVVVNASVLLLWDLSLILSPTVFRLCLLCFVCCGFYTSLRVSRSCCVEFSVRLCL